MKKNIFSSHRPLMSRNKSLNNQKNTNIQLNNINKKTVTNSNVKPPINIISNIKRATEANHR